MEIVNTRVTLHAGAVITQPVLDSQGNPTNETQAYKLMTDTVVEINTPVKVIETVRYKSK